VTLDGALVDPATLGAAQPADPGAHVIRAEAEGFATAEQRVTLMERGSATVALSLRPRASVVAPAPPPAAGGPWKILGFSALGLGGGGPVLGAATGIVALGRHADLAKVCPQSDCAGHAAEISRGTCAPCAAGRVCNLNLDCASGVCKGNGTCQ
jgi:hypothetical protein